MPSVEAYCDMSTVPPTTIVHPASACTHKVQGFAESKSYSMEVEYGFSDEVRNTGLQHVPVLDDPLIIRSADFCQIGLPNQDYQEI